MRINLNDDNDVDVQMSPLIDCVFLLLIFFLVATSLKKIERVLPLDYPEPTVAQSAVNVQTPEGMFVVAVDEAGTLFLGTQPVTQGRLYEEIRARAAENPDQPMRIAADRRAPFGAVLSVVELAKFEGLSDVEWQYRNQQ
ncbi:MAG: ExbD/TolR family protein [Phycisphaerae bacterium]